MKDKIKYFPITIFSIIMGLSGLSIVLNKFYHLQWLPKIFYDILLFVSFALFLLFIFLYGLKAIYFFEEVKRDFQHRIRINFFSAISISFLLLSIAFYSYWPILAIALWWIGLILHTYLMLHTISFWIQHNFEIHFFNPAWFIPVVGNILIPIIGVDFLPKAISYIYFSIGFFFWIILFTIFLYRVIFHDQLPAKFMPTLFILLAPPAVGFIAYIRIAQSWDNFAIFLLFMAYFFFALLIFLWKNFKKLKYYLSWWAFTFPLDAITIASVVAYQITHYSIFKYLSFIFFALAVVTICVITIQTIQQILKGQICINEE